MKVIIMSGIPGSGKSSYVERLQREDCDSKFLICSADHYFQKNKYGRFDPDSEYKFDASKLSQAHGECLKQFTQEIVPGSKSSSWADVIVVDNTNSTALELAPYVSLAMAYNIPVEIVNIDCDAYVAAERNIHGVSYAACSIMAANLRNRSIPVYWNVKNTHIDSLDY